MAERTRTAGWLPNQHGAWAMLVAPFLAGTIRSWQQVGPQPYLAPMFATWILGYFAFHAASGLLKSAPARRRRWLPALTVYGGLTAASGLVTVWLAGPAVLWWLAAVAVPLCVALWLASRRKERRLAGGLLTTGVAATMLVVVRFPDPSSLLTDPAAPSTVTLAAIMFGYFGGTVLHVKAMIRERGRLAWRNASVGWHAAWSVATAALAVTTALDRIWPVFFLVTTLRAWLLPAIAERRPLRPRTIGLVEIVLSAGILAAAALTS